MVTIRTADQLKQALGAQIEALKSSCAAYDNGAEWEATRLATTVYVLVHDGGKRNKSLLTQLRKRDSLLFVASGIPMVAYGWGTHTPLVQIALTSLGDGNISSARYSPLLDSKSARTRRLKFSEWWDREVVIQHNKQSPNPASLTRKKLVYALRNKEGGSHYDAVVEDPNYIAVSQNPAWIIQSNEKRLPLLHLEYASMRQIAWEVLQTLEQETSAP